MSQAISRVTSSSDRPITVLVEPCLEVQLDHQSMRDTARPVILVRELHVERLLVEHFERPVKFFGLTDGRPQVRFTR